MAIVPQSLGQAFNLIKFNNQITFDATIKQAMTKEAQITKLIGLNIWGRMRLFKGLIQNFRNERDIVVMKSSSLQQRIISITITYDKASL